jgi:hypothetical protein
MQEELRNDISEEERVEEMKSRIAELGTTVLSDPEGNMDSLIELQGFSTDKNSNIARMALLSLLVVFKDIIPGYVSLFFALRNFFFSHVIQYNTLLNLLIQLLFNYTREFELRETENLNVCLNFDNTGAYMFVIKFYKKNTILGI